MEPRTRDTSPPLARRSSSSTRGNDGPFSGLRLGRIFGVEIFIDWSLAIIFALVAVGLGAGALPRWHPEWNAVLRWTVAFAAAVAFFASILVHELSHAVVGRAVGVHVPRITLFVFGGMAHMHGEPSSPKAELLMAGVGPLTSAVIGLLASVIGVQLVALGGTPPTDPEELVRAAGPLATILLWLGPLNMMLALFNLVPGFPLDGGRLLRALLWWRTGDLEKATRMASGSGRAVGWALMIAGLFMAFGFRVPIFGTGVGSGLWLALIGWFLNNAARASYTALRIKNRLTRVPVREVMRSSLDTVTPEMPLAMLVRDHIMRSDQTSFPVTIGTDLAGVISVRDIQRVPSERWPNVTVAEVMTPATELPRIDIDADASKALECLAERDLEQLPVVDHGRLSGFVRRQDILKWLSLQPEPAV
jgi:Zn-dependent protease/CBS domain-containing protein